MLADYEVNNSEMSTMIFVTVNVLDVVEQDVNENAPQFGMFLPFRASVSSYGVFVPAPIPMVRANAPPGDTIVIFSVKDDDKGDAERTDCKVDNPKFRLDMGYPNDSGMIFTAVQFNEIPGAVENVKITCTDRGTPPLSVTKEFAVSVVGPKHEQRITRDEVALLKRLLKRSWKK